MLKVTICGGGNVGHVLACELARNVELSITLLVSSSERARLWNHESGRPKIMLADGSSEKIGILDNVTHDPRIAMAGPDLVILALPSTHVASTLRRIAPFCTKSTLLGAIPGHGGFNWQVTSAFKSRGFQPTMFGFDRSPWTCRVIASGKSVQVFGRKDTVGIFVEPRNETGVVVRMLTTLLELHLNPLPSALHAILGGTNQFVHPAIYYGKLRNWDGLPFKEPPMAYEGTDIATAEAIVGADRDCARVREGLDKLDPTLALGSVPPIFQRLGGKPIASDLEALTIANILSTRPSLRGIHLPCYETLEGWMPDFSSRFLSEDIPFGLCIIKSIAELQGSPTPVDMYGLSGHFL